MTAASRSLAGRRNPVLIVNSFDGRDMYAAYLTHHGLDVSTASTPESALELLGSLAPAVVVTDLVFLNSAADPLEFIERIRRTAAGALSAVIVVSGYVRQSDQEAARSAGADMFLFKPCAPDELLSAVRAGIRANRAGRRLRWTSRVPVRNDASATHRRRKSDLEDAEAAGQ